jgi:tetratricopeptide (TPR) repeat protein
MSRVARRDAAVPREVEIAFAEKERPIFYAEEIDLSRFGGCRLVPAGLVQQLLRPGEAPATIHHEIAPFPASDPEDYLESHLAGVALYREATWLEWSGRVDDARDRYAEAAKRAWGIPAIVRNCGLGWLEMGDFAEAEKLFLRTLQMEPHNQDALYDVAVLCSYTGRPEEALGYYAVLDSLNTGFPEVPLNYATSLLAAGRLEEAGRQVQKALKLAPDLESAKHLDDAIRRGLAVGGDEGVLEAKRLAGSLTIDGTLQLAQRYLDRGDWEHATALYREAAGQAPDRPGAAYGLGYGLLRVGQTREAAAAFRKLLTIDPNSADGRNALAYVFAETGDSLAVAERLTLEALQLNPALAPYWRDTLGWVRYRAGRQGDALEALLDAERSLPVDDLSMRAENQYHLGKVMLALGRKDEARDHFRKSAALAKDETWVPDLKARSKELGVQGTS